MEFNTHLHIVSFDNPYPPDYGGVIDVFYKIKELHALGIKITLHVFHYGREIHQELSNYCEEIHYYKRRKLVNPFSSVPYIVTTRANQQLLLRLVQADYPILFEGLHTCYYLRHPKLKHRMKLVRMHNIEHDYYDNLKEVETSYLKRLFFSQEAKKLRQYESVLHHADKILAISNNDATYLSSKFKNVFLVSAFHANTTVSAKTGRGEYALYHGKLSVGENDEAARFLVEKVFNKSKHPLFIAGNQPSEQLKSLIKKTPNVTLFDHLHTEQISDLIAHAHVNVLPTFQATGIKLKLINVLFQGRFVLANSTMVSNTGCEALTYIANTPEGFVEQLDQIFAKNFSETDLENRKVILSTLFNNRQQAEYLVQLLQPQ